MLSLTHCPPWSERRTTVWYFNHAVGRVQDLTYIPVDKIGNSSCNATARESILSSRPESVGRLLRPPFVILGAICVYSDLVLREDSWERGLIEIQHRYMWN